MIRKLLATLGFAVGTWFVAAPATAAIAVTFDPVSQHVNVGDSVSVDLRISGLGNEVLSGFDLNVLFDQAILSAGGSVTFLNASLGGPWLFNAEFNAGNRGLDGVALTFPDNALASLQDDDSFVFARLHWTTLADGFTLLDFGADVNFERSIVGRDALSLAADFGTACISVGTGACAQVPEPSSVSLVALALAGAMGVGLRRRREPRPVVA